MKHSTDIFFKYILLTLVVLISGVQNAFSQPVPATITNSNPSNNQILNALNGGGITLSLGAGDGLVNGVRNEQVAIFSGGDNAKLGMNEGVFFTTGNATVGLSNRNVSLGQSDHPQNQVLYVDPDLTGISNMADGDVVVYKFKVKLANYSSALRVVFQFGSEEYPNFVGSPFNDAFGFFVRPASPGATLPGGVPVINMAKLPISGNPISINTVNYGVAGSEGDNSFSGLDLNQSQHYLNNGHSTVVAPNGRLVVNDNSGPKPIFIEYNGLTKLITYDLTGLVPGETYEFKIAIADASDDMFDSGVLIKKIQGTTGADVKIEKTVDNMAPLIGSIVEFKLTASNLGPYNAANTSVDDLLPSGYTYVSHTASNGNGNYNPATGLWTIGNLAAIFQTETLTVRAVVKESGVHTNIATITSTELDPDYDNNMSSVNPLPSPPCIDQFIFLDDFGTSDKNVAFGRTVSSYVPSTGYSFGIPNPTSVISAETSIGDGYYAAVAPGNVKYGWKPADLGSYNWTPSYDEAGAVTDVSGTTKGAALAVNGNGSAKPFYERGASLEYNTFYKVALWVYVISNPSQGVNNPTQIAIDIKNSTSGVVYGSALSSVFSPSNEGQWVSVNISFKLPQRSALSCDIKDVLISFKDKSVTQARNFYVDNISLSKLKNDATCIPNTFIDLKCPVRMIITNPMMPSKVSR